MGRAGEGNAEGSPTGFQHPVRWKEQPKKSFLRNDIRLWLGLLTLRSVEDHDQDDNESYHNYPSEDANYGAPDEGDGSDSNDTIDVLQGERHGQRWPRPPLKNTTTISVSPSDR